MKEAIFYFGNIPSILYGEDSAKLYVFIHGKHGCKEEAMALAEIVCRKGFQVLSVDLPGHGQRKNEMDSFVPWKVVPELQTVLYYAKKHWNHISLRADSIGAYFSLLAYGTELLEKSLLVSPVVDMEKLIRDMMRWANVAESDLRKREKIPTDFGEILDWTYFQYAKKHPIIHWNCRTAILYAGKDQMIQRQTIDTFTSHFDCELTVVEEGEHWFHTAEQMEILNQWIEENC